MIYEENMENLSNLTRGRTVIGRLYITEVKFTDIAKMSDIELQVYSGMYKYWENENPFVKMYSRIFLHNDLKKLEFAKNLLDHRLAESQ